LLILLVVTTVGLILGWRVWPVSPVLAGAGIGGRSMMRQPVQSGFRSVDVLS
jgi:hypothetical protein